ncbi:MAG: LPXTG cell wall anchor domain-containing protein [Micromonosporaceae bacterium]|nr:LPXTG cell wall anchor domain-containing protein [Micromonosporaceae bacterium]
MRHSLLSVRRARTVVGAGAAGALAALAFMTPAFATDGPLLEAKHSEQCNAQNRVEITWGVKLTELGAEEIADQSELAIEVTPEPTEEDWVDLSGSDEISADAWNESRQTLPAGTTTATLRVTIPGGKATGEQELVSLTVDVSSVCKKPSASVTPTTSATGATLPVTGSNTGLIAGTAVVLVVVGAGAYLIARRRRVRFTA